jgi:hypothetical protein
MPEFDPDIAWLFVAVIVVLAGVGFISYKANKEQN